MRNVLYKPQPTKDTREKKLLRGKKYFQLLGSVYLIYIVLHILYNQLSL